MQLGFSAFSIDGAQEHDKALELVGWGAQHGMKHPQYAVGLMSDETAKAVQRRCAAKGSLASSLVFLGPDYYPFNPAKAIEALKPQLARAMLLAPDCCRVVGPLFRPLGDPKTGLVEAGDRQQQVDFLGMLAEEIAQYSTMQLGLEMINNHESRGPNTYEEGEDLLKAVPGGEKFLYLPDTCHVTMCETNPARAWAKLLARAALIHLSSFGRQHLGHGIAVSKDLVLAAHASGLPMIMELFGKDTPDGFFDLLHVHSKGNFNCQELFLEGLRYVESLLAS